MKNSLFKRAFAAAAAVPLALTQCLTVANAASVNNADIAAVENETVAASDNSVTLNGKDGLAYITPGKETDGKDYYMVGDTALADLELTEGSYTITKDSVWNETVIGKLLTEAGKTGSFSIQQELTKAAKKAGNYEEEVNKIIKHVGDVNYKIEENGDITLTCEVSDFASEFTKSTAVKVGGTFTAVIKSSALQNGTEVEGTLTFVSSEGKEYKGTAVANYGLEKIAEVEAKFGADNKYADALAFFKRQFNRVNTYTDKALAKTTEEKQYGSIDEALAAAKASRFGQKAEAKAKKEIPSTVEEASSNSTVTKLYDKIVKEINDNTSYTVAIKQAEAADFAKTFYDITAQLNAGEATLKAKFTDAEREDVEKYFASEYGLKVEDCYKTVDVKVDYSKVKDGVASADVKVQRIVEAVTTASTTSETTPTDTATTPTDTATTPTDTDTTPTDTATTPTDTATTPTDTATTPTGEVTRVERKTVSNYTIAAKTGFYLNIDKEFKKEQIESVQISKDVSDVYYNADDEIIGQEVVEAGTKIDITDKVDFGTQTPANVFVDGDYEFAHKIALYATEDITNGEETVVKAGDKIVKYNGEDLAVIAYVGVKGDGDLNYKAESKDASLVLVWYSKMSTGKDPEKEVFSNSNLITEIDAEGARVLKENYDENLDQFAAFLCDVDNENAEDNWYALKPARMIDAKDASFILKMYSKASTNVEPNRDTWNEILGEKFAKKD